MTYVRRCTALVLSLLSLCAQAQAQWQVQKNGVPLGRGGGASGFDSVLGTNGQALFGVTNGKPLFRPPSFTDLIGNISTGQMAGGTNANSSTFWRGDGTWSAAAIVSGTFDTLAAASAAHIPASVNMVVTLGRVAVGDNGGANYIRIASSTAAAWRFQSADGQWWAINNRAITPEMFNCFGSGTTDCTNAFQQMATYVNGVGGPGGYVINGTPGALYNIFPVGGSAPNLMQFTGLSSLTWNFNGSCIVTDFVFTGQVGIVGFSHSTNVEINEPCYNERSWTHLTNTAGGVFLTIQDQAVPYSNNFIFNNITMNGGVAALRVSGDVAASASSVGSNIYGIQVNNADLSNVYYGLNFEAAGDNFTGRGVHGHNNGRLYFPWNVSHHDVELIGDGGPNTQLLFKTYAYPKMPIARRQLSDIKVRYRLQSVCAGCENGELSQFSMQQVVPDVTISAAANNGSGKTRLTVNSTADMATGETWFFAGATGTTAINGNNLVTVIDGTHVDLQSVNFVATSPGGYATVPATIKDVSVIFDVTNDGTNGSPLVGTSKFDAFSVVDSETRGYNISNINIGGALLGYNNGVGNVFNLFSPTFGTWTGETINNFSIRNMVLSGTGTVSVTAPNAANSVYFENIVSDNSIIWGLGGTASALKFGSNVRANGLTDHNTVIPAFAPASQFSYGIDANGGILFRQPEFADLSGIWACSQSPAFTGDITKSSGSCGTLLASVNSNVGTFGSATSCVTVTNNAKGLTTAISAATCTPAFSSLTGQATLAQFPNIAANTVLTNATSGSAVPTAFAMPSCSSAASALTWTTNSGFACNTSVTAAAAPLSGITGLGSGVATAAANAINAAGGLVTVTAANQISRGMEAQGVARSVVGVTGNATANVADIQGTTSQWFGINAAGTAALFQTLGGDCTGSITAIVCTKTNGVSFATVATSGSASDLSTGTLPAGRMPAFTGGDISSSAGTVNPVVVANAVTNAKAAQMAANTIKGNNTGSTANAADLTVPQMAAMLTARTRQVLTSGTAATYTTPANVKYLVVRMVGGGGGGGGAGTGAPTSGTAGGNTTFSTFTAGGGGAGLATGLGPTNGATGGTAAGGTVNIAGGSSDPQAPGFVVWGTHGGGTVFSAGGAYGTAAVGAGTAATNSGGGGGGGGSTAAALTNGTGGGGGGYVEAVTTSPAATYTYTVGTAGTAGAGGTNGNGGAAGTAGIIIVDEFYQ